MIGKNRHIASHRTNRGLVWRMIRFATLLLLLICNRANAAGEARANLEGTNHLVDVRFAMDDKPAHETFHTVIDQWLTASSSGGRAKAYDWAIMGGENPDALGKEKAAKCLQILKRLDQPTNLPNDPNQILTVKCKDGDEILERKFSIRQVPASIRELLSLIGIKRTEEFDRFTFVEETARTNATHISTDRR